MSLSPVRMVFRSGGGGMKADDTQWPATAEVYLNNLSRKPIAYKLKTNRSDSFQVMPRAQGVVGGKRTIRLVLSWVNAPNTFGGNDDQTVTTPTKLLLLTRFLSEGDDEKIWAQTDGANVTETPITAEIRPTTAFDRRRQPRRRAAMDGSDDGGKRMAINVRPNERLITSAQIFLEDSSELKEEQMEEGKSEKVLMVDCAVETEPITTTEQQQPKRDANEEQLALLRCDSVLGWAGMLTNVLLTIAALVVVYLLVV